MRSQRYWAYYFISPIQFLIGLDDPVPLPPGYLLLNLRAVVYSGARILLATLRHRTQRDMSTPLGKTFTLQSSPFNGSVLARLDHGF